jgi:hypothetical protein
MANKKENAFIDVSDLFESFQDCLAHHPKTTLQGHTSFVHAVAL